MPQRTRRGGAFPVMAGALLGAACGAAAQPASPRERAREAGEQAQEIPQAPEGRPVTFSVRVAGELGLGADLDDAGDVTIVRGRTGATVGVPIGERSVLSLGYDYELSDYDFDDATGLIPGTARPWGTIHSHGLSATFVQRASLRWFWMVGGGVAWAAEEGADLGDGFTANGFGAAQFAVTEKLVVGFGAGVRSRLEDSALVYPVILLDWTISDKWKLTNEGRPGLTASYAPTEQLTIDFTGGFEFRDFRLDDSGSAPGGVGIDSRLPLSAGVTWTPNPTFTFSARAGAYLFAELEADDANGTKVGESDVDPSPFIALEGRLRF